MIQSVKNNTINYNQQSIFKYTVDVTLRLITELIFQDFLNRMVFRISFVPYLTVNEGQKDP